MNSEYNSGEEPKDRTKLIWAGVLALVVVMLLAMWGMGQARPATSEVRARHILVGFGPGAADAEARVEAYEKAQELRERLLEGESFSRLARRYSDDERSAARGGDLGYASRDTFQEAFDAYLWEGSIGEISPIIETTNGYHIIEILDRRWSEADRYTQEIRRRSLEDLEAEEPEAP